MLLRLPLLRLLARDYTMLVTLPVRINTSITRRYGLFKFGSVRGGSWPKQKEARHTKREIAANYCFSNMALCIKTVLISEPVDPGCAKILSENGVQVTTKIGLSKNELIEEIKVSIFH